MQPQVSALWPFVSRSTEYGVLSTAYGWATSCAADGRANDFQFGLFVSKAAANAPPSLTDGRALGAGCWPWQVNGHALSSSPAPAASELHDPHTHGQDVQPALLVLAPLVGVEVMGSPPGAAVCASPRANTLSSLRMFGATFIPSFLSPPTFCPLSTDRAACLLPAEWEELSPCPARRFCVRCAAPLQSLLLVSRLSAGATFLLILESSVPTFPTAAQAICVCVWEIHGHNDRPL